jgi:hypothetical protein
MAQIVGIIENKMMKRENLLTFMLFHSFFGRMEKFTINKDIVK